MAETLLWVLPLVPTVTALLMLTTRDRRILSAIDVGGSAVLARAHARPRPRGGSRRPARARRLPRGRPRARLSPPPRRPHPGRLHLHGGVAQAGGGGRQHEGRVPAVLLRSRARLRRDDGRDGPRRQPRRPLDRDGRDDDHLGRPHRLPRPSARPGGGVEVHHRDDHRHLLRPLRHGARLCRRRRRHGRRGRDELVGDHEGRSHARPGDRPDRLHLRDGRLRHQGGSRAHAPLAAGRP